MGFFCCSTLTPQEQSGRMFAGFGEHENQQTFNQGWAGVPDNQHDIKTNYNLLKKTKRLKLI